MIYKRGDILCVESGTNPITKLISFFQKVDRQKNSQMSHVAICINSAEVVEATSPLVKITPISKIVTGKKPIWKCELTDENRSKFLLYNTDIDAFIAKAVGKPYDYLQIAKDALHIVSFGLYKPKEDKFNVCSELAGKILKIAHIIDGQTATLSPADIFNLDIYKNKENINV